MKVFIARNKGDETNEEVYAFVTEPLPFRDRNYINWSGTHSIIEDSAELLLRMFNIEIHPGECREFEITLSPIENKKY